MASNGKTPSTKGDQLVTLIKKVNNCIHIKYTLDISNEEELTNHQEACLLEIWNCIDTTPKFTKTKLYDNLISKSMHISRYEFQNILKYIREEVLYNYQPEDDSDYYKEEI